MHIRVDDMVEIRGGREKGLRAKVLRVLHDDGKVVVEGVNRVFKHMRKSQKNPRGGRLQKEMPVPASVVAAGRRIVSPFMPASWQAFSLLAT